MVLKKSARHLSTRDWTGLFIADADTIQPKSPSKRQNQA